MAANNQQQAQLDALLQQIDQLNADNQALQAQAAVDAQQLQAAAAAAAAAAAVPVNAAAAPVNPPPVVPAAFASCPGRHNSARILNFDRKIDSSIYKNGCKSVYDGEMRFDGTAKNLTMFITLLRKRSEGLAWCDSSNPQQIILFNVTLPGGTATTPVNVITQYAMIKIEELSLQCARFMTGVDREERANQNNHMMAECILSSLTPECQLKLTQYEKEYTIGGTICAALLFKVLMRMSTMDSVATIKSLKADLLGLPAFAAKNGGDVPMILAKFVETRNRLRAAGVEVDSTQDNLFAALTSNPVEKFAQYISLKEDAHDDGSAPMSADDLVIVAQQKFNLMVDRGEWAAESKKKDELVAMQAMINDLKGKLTLTDKTKAAAGGGNDANTKKTGKEFQKKDEAWKKVPPAAGEPRTKKIKDRDFNWCEHHMAWVMHSPCDCRLRPGYVDPATTTTTPTAASATDTTATVANPHALTAEAILGRLESAIGASTSY